MTSFMKLIGVCSVALVGIGSPAYAVTGNLLANGDFETTDGTLGVTTGGSNGDRLDSLKGKSGNQSWDVFSTLPGGWFSPSGNGIEVQTNNTIGGLNGIVSRDSELLAPGFHYVELDSERTRDLPDSNSSIAQTIVGMAVGWYEFSFYYSPRTGNVGENDNQIKWDISATSGISPNPLSGDISGPGPESGNLPATQVGQWSRISAFFEVLVAGTDVTVKLSADGKENEYGGFIDNVSVVESIDPRSTVVPVPAPLLLIASAFGLAGAVRRFSRSA